MDHLNTAQQPQPRQQQQQQQHQPQPQITPPHTIVNLGAQPSQQQVPYQLIPQDPLGYAPPNQSPSANGCLTVMTCLACTIPVALPLLAGALFLLSLKYVSEKDTLTTGGYVCIAAFIASCIAFVAYFCLRKKQPGDQLATMNGFLCCSACGETAQVLSSCGLLCAICAQ